jgi:DNA helicase-2/ATP-dependent DNA helicase PcrA
MPLPNDVIIAAAGGGKTTRIARRALATPRERAAMVTFTNNNTEEIEKRLRELNACVPPHITVRSWFSFLIREMARPYQNALYSRRIDGLHWSNGQSTRGIAKTNIVQFYFSKSALVYSDKVAQFICAVNQATGGAVVARLEQRFDRIYIDEIQDMAGYDFDLIELLLKSEIKMTLVGDHRQATFRTNNAAKNKATSGINIIDRLKAWETMGLCTLTYDVETHRCNQQIADLADSLYPDQPKTRSKNQTKTGHDGVFVIATAHVPAYMERFRPQVLRLDRRTACQEFEAKNFGDSKGLTFERVLIFPHKKGMDWLSTGNIAHIEGSLSKLYVGITRARYSVTFVTDAETGLPNVARHKED